jgi:hypothetical protein
MNIVKYKYSIRQTIAVTLALFLIAVSPMIFAWWDNSTDLHYYILRAICIMLALGLMVFALRPQGYFVNLTAINILGLMVMLCLFVYLLGRTFGLYVDTDGTPHRIVLRETPNTTRVIGDAKLILFTSHHLIVKVPSEVSTFPTADILEVTSPAKDWMPLFPFQ